MASETIQRVIIEDTASPDEVAAVDEVFARFGLDVHADPGYARRSAGDLPWVVYVALAVPIAEYFRQLAAEAAKDTYPHIKAWVKAVWEARTTSGNGEGSMVLQDPDGTNLVLASRIPDEALDALADVDWDDVTGDYLIWDEELKQWFDRMRSRRS